jgi:ribosomal protein L31
MARDIHPSLTAVNVKCSGCSNTFQLHIPMKGNTLDTEYCYKCSPAFTGKRRASSAGHGSEAFKKRFGAFSKLSQTSDKKD